MYNDVFMFQAILASDKNHYNALVFVGVAAEGLDQADQAVKAYKRATDSNPEQLLAWQVMRHCKMYRLLQASVESAVMESAVILSATIFWTASMKSISVHNNH